MTRKRRDRRSNAELDAATRIAAATLPIDIDEAPDRAGFAVEHGVKRWQPSSNVWACELEGVRFDWETRAEADLCAKILRGARDQLRAIGGAAGDELRRLLAASAENIAELETRVGEAHYLTRRVSRALCNECATWWFYDKQRYTTEPMTCPPCVEERHAEELAELEHLVPFGMRG